MKDGDRGQWENKTEYILVVAGNVVGLGNVWRFPYLCYKNGGGAFLVPYGLLAVVFGIPLFLLEIFSGQYTQEGFITCWRKLCPLAQGIGCGQTVTILNHFSYIIVQVWALFYLVFSFKSQLPWTNCENTWNSVNCISLHKLDSSSPNVTENQTMSTNPTSAASEFWERRVLAMSGGIQELGSVRWELALCLLFCWVVTYFSIWKGVRSSGKVAYFTATFPYVMLLILLVRGLTLPGAWDGIRFYLNPDLSRLADLEFVTVESFITSISDLFPKLLRAAGRSEIFVLIVCSFFFFIHLTMVTEISFILYLVATHTLSVCTSFVVLLKIQPGREKKHKRRG
ncbi:hypothetical protein INR49_009326 [Caranx melampygus]|nr:hypothetical protein INR49_009326 [Caranx melampygus]